MNNEGNVHVRYMVDDVAAALDFYTTHFGFQELSERAARRSPMSAGETCDCC